MKNKKGLSAGNSFIKNFIGFSISSYFCAIITFVASIINTRIYGPTIMGQINLFFSVQTFILYFAYFGVDQSYCRYYYEYSDKEKKKLMNICVTISLAATFILCFILMIGWQPISKFVIGDSNSKTIVIALILSVVAQVVWRYFTLLERMKRNIFLFTILMVLNTITNKLSFTSVAWYSKKIDICVLAIGISSFLVTLFCYLFTKENIRLLSLRKLRRDMMVRKVVRFGFPLMPVSLISWVNSYIPIVLLRYFSSYDAVGVYSTSVVLVSIIGLIQNGLNAFWVPYYYENYKTHNERIKKVHNVVCYIMVSVAILLILFKNVIYLILGEEYRMGTAIFAFLLVSPICYTIGETTGIGIGISEKSYLNSVIFLVGAAVNFTISIFLIPLYGLVGASVGVAISSLCTLIFKTIAGEKYYQVISNRMKTVSALVSMLLVTIIDFTVSQYSEVLKASLIVIILCILTFIYRNEVKICINEGAKLFKIKKL